MASRRGPAVAHVLGSAVLFGTTGTAQSLGPDGTTPLGVGSVRLLLGRMVLLAVLLALLGGRLDRAVALWRSPYRLAAGVCTTLHQRASSPRCSTPARRSGRS